MRVIEPKRTTRRSPTRRVRTWIKRTFIFVVGTTLLLSVLVSSIAWLRPSPTIFGVSKNIRIASKPYVIAWPTVGQAAIGASGMGILEQHSDEQPRPMASINKVLTALTVLKKNDISPDKSGPILTLTEKDEALYRQYISQGGSVIRVQNGEALTLYQAIQALMLPSANNIADSLAIWAYGSMNEYLQAANDYALSLGMVKTKVADASGLSPATVSTPTDLIRLAEAAMKNQVVAEIVAQQTAVLPVHGSVTNLNFLLGKNEVNGIKTGNTDEAGGCFLGSAVVTAPNNRKITVFVAVIASKDLEAALRDAAQLLEVARAGFTMRELIPQDTVVGYYDIPWQGRVTVKTSQPITVYGWNNMSAKVVINIDQLQADRQQKATAGSVKVSVGNQNVATPVVIEQSARSAPYAWKLTHLFNPNTGIY